MRRAAVMVGAMLSAVLLGGVARAMTPPPVYALTEEDDGIFTHQDRHYTQGLMLTRTASPTAGGFWEGLSNDLAQAAGWLGAGPVTGQRYQFPIIGQSIFTPTNIAATVPNPHDRPYAAWLYVGAGLMQRSESGRIDHFQLLVGVVGPSAMGEQIQNGYHGIVGYGTANGWNHQLHDEPGLVATYRTTWDEPLYRSRDFEIDALPQLGVTVGNLWTYGEGGLILRLGQELAAGGTPQTVTPGLSGPGWFNPSRMDGPFGWMLYGGVQTRAVWRDLFLEGNSYRNSPGVEKRNFVTDEDVGISLLFRFGLRVDISYIKRSREFSGQVNDDRIGSITLSTPF